MLDDLDSIPWSDLDHAYGSAADVPDLLRQLQSDDPKIRSTTIGKLYGNIFHQGTRFPATPHVIPFIIELCASTGTPERGDILTLWGSLITGYFSVQERPVWGDGRLIYWHEESHVAGENEEGATELHAIYTESLNGIDLLVVLLGDADPRIRHGAAWVLACLPTMKENTVPALTRQLRVEPVDWVRGVIAFALGELGAVQRLREILRDDADPIPRCMAACELARTAPGPELLPLLLEFLAKPVPHYESIRGAGGKSTGDAAFAISRLPAEIQVQAVPALCDCLDQAGSFDTMPFASTLLQIGFTPSEEPRTEFTDLQRQILLRMLANQDLWKIGNLHWTFKHFGLPQDRKKIAALVGVQVSDDAAFRLLSTGLLYSKMNFLEKGRAHINSALVVHSI